MQEQLILFILISVLPEDFWRQKESVIMLKNVGIAMAMHMAGSPVCFMANVHCAAATQNFLALEHHSVDTPWWKNLVKMTGSTTYDYKGFANVPLDAPGLELNLMKRSVKSILSKRQKVSLNQHLNGIRNVHTTGSGVKDELKGID